MQIVIDIPKYYYENNIKNDLPIYLPEDNIIAILPKGHGRLFDERDIVNGNYEVIGNRIYELEPIIEADKGADE